MQKAIRSYLKMKAQQSPCKSQIQINTVSVKSVVSGACELPSAESTLLPELALYMSLRGQFIS